MKKGYIPKDQRKKILLLSDDIRTSSGVGTMSKEIVINTAHRYNWINIGGAVKHPENGKGFDISVEVNKHTKIKDSSVKIIDHLFEDFKVSSIRHKFNLQKLANRAVHLYLTDEEFRKKLHNHTDLTISGSL